MRRLIAALPGPPAVQYALAGLAGLVLLVALFIVYDWVGANLLDSGGAVG